MHEPEDFETKALRTPCAVNGWVYAQKTAALKVSGEVKCALGTIKLDDIECYGHHDFSSGFMRRETFWKWACFSSTLTQDKPTMGLNISWAVNETGYSESCLWLGSQCIELPQVQFECDRDAIIQTWHVRSANDAVKLSFTPHGKHSESLALACSPRTSIRYLDALKARFVYPTISSSLFQMFGALWSINSHAGS